MRRHARWQHAAILLLAVGCAHAPLRIPGPTNALGRTPRSWPRAISTVSSDSSAPSVTTTPSQVSPSIPVSSSPTPAAKPAPTHAFKRQGAAIASAARSLLDHAPRTGWRRDCSGFVCLTFDRAGLPVEGNTETLWNAAVSDGRVHHRKRPDPGDLAFFDNTWDRDGNGRLDDELTHVAIVIDVDANGTITLAHYATSGGLTRLVMNLDDPNETHNDAGDTINEALRRKRAGDPPKTRYLASELLRGFASPTR